MTFQFSQHALKQMDLRGISREMVDNILLAPEQTVEQENLIVFQNIIKDSMEQRYLIRVFINFDKTPPLIVTVYRTSKIEKYYEGKI